MAYIGVSPSNGVRRKHTYTATASQTSFSGAGDEGATLSYSDSNFVDVYQNGVKLAEEDYTATSGTAIVLAQGASADDIVEIIAFDVFSVADTVSKADGGTFDGNVTMAGTLGVTGVLTANGGAVFNEASADVDFRVESNGNANMLFVDGGNDRVGIGTSVPDVQLHLSSADGSSIIRIERNDTAIVENDIYGAIEFEGQDGSSGASGVRAKIQAIAEAGVSGETSLQFFTAVGGATASEQVRIHSNGVLSASDGIALGVGTANTASNVLDDYEEGTWTPQINFGGASVSIAYTSRVGHYTKIGRMVYASFDILLSNKGSSTGGTTIDGLPFANYGSTQNNAGTVINEGGGVDWPQSGVYGMVWSDGNIYVRYQNTTAFTDVTNAKFSNTTKLFGMMVYETT